MTKTSNGRFITARQISRSFTKKEARKIHSFFLSPHDDWVVILLLLSAWLLNCLNFSEKSPATRKAYIKRKHIENLSISSKNKLSFFRFLALHPRGRERERERRKEEKIITPINSNLLIQQHRTYTRPEKREKKKRSSSHDFYCK